MRRGSTWAWRTKKSGGASKPVKRTPRLSSSSPLDKLGSPAEAEACLEKLVELAPEREDAWFRLGYYRLVRDDYHGSSEAFRYAVAKRPDWLEALINLGLAQWRTQDTEGAKGSFVEAIARHPQSADALLALGALSIEMNDCPLALDIAAKLDELGEPSVELTYNAGVLLERSNLTEEAARCYRQATQAKPDFAEALLNLGNALSTLGQEEEAKTCWQQALEVKPELAKSYF